MPTIFDLQRRIDTAIRYVGGYWRPLSALARLLEELAELADLFSVQDRDLDEIGREMADVFIISTCLANQYCAHLDDEYEGIRCSRFVEEIDAPAALEGSPLVYYLKLVAQSGEVARIVNAYEGDKTRKPGDSDKSLARSVAEFQVVLLGLAKLLRISLIPRIEEVIARSLARDSNRFHHSRDPTTELSVDNFNSVISSTECPFARSAKLWGLPEWNRSCTFEENVRDLLPTLRRFVKVSAFEGLDGLVLQVQGGEFCSTLFLVCRTFRTILELLSSFDPSHAGCMEVDILDPEWQFSFAGQRFFVSVFGPCYSTLHPRFSGHMDSMFIFFQPEFSFDLHGISKTNPDTPKVKERIRFLFAAAGKGYSGDLIDKRLEALIYIMPLNESDPPVRWWQEESP